jgi:hypothetical protein
MQQQVVHGHFDHLVPQQKGSLREEDLQIAPYDLLPRLHRCINLVNSYAYATAFRPGHL